MSFLAELERRLDEAAGIRERTRARLVLGVAELLSRQGYDEALVRQVCEELGLSRGAFYQYFANRTEVVAEVLDGFCEFVYAKSVGVGRGRSDFGRINEVTRFYIEIYTTNQGLFGTQYRLAREESAYSRGWRILQERWRGRLAHYIARATGAGDAAHPYAATLSYMLTSLADDLLYRLYFEREPSLAWLRDDAGGAAAYISVVWYRAIFGEDPKEEMPGVDLSLAGRLPILRHHPATRSNRGRGPASTRRGRSS